MVTTVEEDPVQCTQSSLAPVSDAVIASGALIAGVTLGGASLAFCVFEVEELCTPFLVLTSLTIGGALGFGISASNGADNVNKCKAHHADAVGGEPPSGGDVSSNESDAPPE